MSLRNIVIIVCVVSLLAMFAGCTSSNTDPIVGTWKQDFAGVMNITMDLKADRTGTMTMDMGTIINGTSSEPVAMTIDIKWEQVNSSFINLYLVSEPDVGPLLLNYDKNSKHLWDSSDNTSFNLYKA